jgi:hypothetical protein
MRWLSRKAAVLLGLACMGDGMADTRVEQAFVVGMLRPEHPFIVKYDGVTPTEPILLAYDADARTFATFESRWLVSGANTVEIKLEGTPVLTSGTNRIPLQVKVADAPIEDIHPITIHANPADETKISVFVTGTHGYHPPGVYRGSVTILFDSK